jgi:hypothetical protein
MDARATAAKLRVGLHPETRRRALWGFGLMAGGSLATLLATSLATLACSPNAAAITGPVAASPAPLLVPDGPPPPSGGLPMPSLDLDWSPPSAAAGDVEALATALARHSRVGLVVDPGVATAGGSDAMRLAALVGRLAPNTAVRPIGSDGAGPTLADLIREDPPLMPTVADDGRTKWVTPERLELDVERLHALAEFGDPAVLVVGPVGVETPVWRQLATGSVGSCEPLLDQLLVGQRESLRVLEPFLDHADAVLASTYVVELAAVVPGVRKELAEFERERDRRDLDVRGWARYQCGRRYLQYLQPFASCATASQQLGAAKVAELEGSHGAGGVKTPCPTTPRLFLRGTARIGSVEPSDYIPSECPQLLGRDYVEALRAPARSAAETTADQLDVRWMILAERLATLAEVYDALDQLCTPRRRRFGAEDLASLHTRVIELGQLYQREEPPAHDARFLDNDASFHVPAIGKVRQLARFDGGTGSASRALIAAAHELGKFDRARSQCVARPGDPPLMAMLIDTARAQPEFLGFFYKEELWCGELGPL